MDRRKGLGAFIAIACAIAPSVPTPAHSANRSAAPSQAENEAVLYADDPTHPIPFLNALDVFAVKKTGGSTLVIVIATPLAGDERSQRRLLRKFDNCLGFIASEEFRREHGAPRPDSTEIKVAINANSDPIIFDLLESCRPWVADNHATLTVERQAK